MRRRVSPLITNTDDAANNYLNATVGNPFTLSGETVITNAVYTTFFTSPLRPYEIFPSVSFDLQDDTGFSGLTFIPSGDFQLNGGYSGGPLGVQAMITYDYTPIPESRGGVAFLTVAFLIVLWLSARRKSRAAER